MHVCIDKDNMALRTHMVLQQPFASREDMGIRFVGDLHSLVVEDSFTNIEMELKRSLQRDLVSLLPQIVFIFN